ncbi:ankyrin [Trametes versicolor FP-101664 SS1]|uniref:ankyrin n=1 Tax=Trametes versicolor (strain FP-101664) TaxID=717944 RepID=UPI0004621D2A|nr:ankyrin [Trametes versicolor FP-101664 SS1]EIW52550.1 ankyrin [Trametes versicolor FP-101664 SS1]
MQAVWQREARGHCAVDPKLSAANIPQATLDFAHRIFDAARDNNAELLLQAVDAGLPPNLTNDKGNTLLMLAAYNGHAELVKELLARGADPDRTNDQGQSPLAGAVFKGHDDVVRVLVEGGANPRLGTPTAIQTARLFRKEELLKVMGVTEDDLKEPVPSIPGPPH